MALLTLSVAGCARDAQTPPDSRDAVQASARQTTVDGRRVIVRLIGREHALTITASQGAPLYTATDRAGNVLVRNVTLDDLRTRFPELHAMLAPNATAMDRSVPTPISTVADCMNSYAD